MPRRTMPLPSALSQDEILDELGAYLRPPGQGVHAVSTGRAEMEAKTARYLGGGWSSDRRWRDHLATTLRDAPKDGAALLAIPSDTGAGIVRGANRGPEAIRARLGTAPCAELGDVFVVPQLLDDEMHSDAQMDRSQDALYPTVELERRRNHPVSPLSMATRVYRLVAALRPDLRILLLGGDHTVTWPAMDALLDPDPAQNADVGIVHFDAHTDLLPERLGITYCFATWAHHANVRLGGGGRMIQLGIRASRHDRAHWESRHDVRQLWGHEVADMDPAALGKVVVDHLKERGIRRVYVSNDIDGTDAKWAAACGTPEPGGLTPDQVVGVLDAVHDAEFQLLGADVVELAPGLSLDAQKSQTSVDTATRYVLAELALITRDTRPSARSISPHAE